MIGLGYARKNQTDIVKGVSDKGALEGIERKKNSEEGGVKLHFY